MTDEYYMRQALIEARQAGEAGEIPVGAVIVCRDRILARTHNLTQTLNDVTAHAEMQAITAAAETLGGKYLTDCTLYVTLELGGKYLTDCTLYVTLEPCVMCAGALGWSQISRIVYGASDPRRGYALFAPKALHPKTQVQGGVLQDEALQLLKDFFSKKR